MLLKSLWFLRWAIKPQPQTAVTCLCIAVVHLSDGSFTWQRYTGPHSCSLFELLRTFWESSSLWRIKRGWTRWAKQALWSGNAEKRTHSSGTAVHSAQIMRLSKVLTDEPHTSQCWWQKCLLWIDNRCDAELFISIMSSIPVTTPLTAASKRCTERWRARDMRCQL